MKMTVDKWKKVLYRILIVILNLLILLLDLFIAAAFLFLIAATVLLLVAIVFRWFNICPEFVDYISVNFVPGKLQDDPYGVDSLVAAFGVFASITLIPVSSFFVSLFLSNKSKAEEIDKQFSSFKNLSLYIISFPYGTWGNQVLNYKRKYGNKRKKSNKKTKPLLDYDYCMCLLFNNDCFQAFKVNVDRVDYEKDGKLVSVFDKKIPYFISDTSGMSDGQQKESTTLLSILLELEDKEIKNETQLEFVKYLFDDSISKNINVVVNLQPRKYSGWKIFANFFIGKYVYVFPIIRSLFRTIVYRMQKGKYHRIGLSLGASLKNINEEDIKFKFEILDINIDTVRKNDNSIIK